MDLNGKPVNFMAEGFLARIIQHESDHLDGVLFIDKAKDLHPLEKEYLNMITVIFWNGKILPPLYSRRFWITKILKWLGWLRRRTGRLAATKYCKSRREDFSRKI